MVRDELYGWLAQCEPYHLQYFCEFQATDPITGDKIKESDIIKLRSAGSGFAAKGAKESEVYRPALAC